MDELALSSDNPTTREDVVSPRDTALNPTGARWLDLPLLAALNWEKLLYAAFILLAIISRFWDLGARVMSHDESLHTYFSYNLATGKGFAHTPLMHGPFLFHITALSYFLFGNNDFTSRIPPAIFGMVLIALPYLFRRWLGRSGALIASFALLISPSILYHARYIRQEEFILVWTILTLLCVWRYLATREMGWLIGLSAILAFHATDKSTSFLTVAMFVIFLAPLAFAQLYASRRRWADAINAVVFTLVLGAVILLGSVLFELVSRFLTARLNPGSIISQLNPLTLNFDLSTLLFAGVIIVLAILLGLALVFLIRRFFLPWLRYAGAVAPAFNIVVVMVTTTMVMASPALLIVLNPLWRITSGTELVKVSLLGDMANLATNPGVIASMFSLSMVLIAVSAAIGIAWNWRRWLPIAGLFGAITTTLFTTVFTNAAGFGTGFVGQLGYWMAQQDVKRGSQPPYYYFLIVPMYEYILVIGAACAVIYLGYRLGRYTLAQRRNSRATAVYAADGEWIDAPKAESATPDMQAVTPSDASTSSLTLTALLTPSTLFPIFLVWWTLATWVIYTVAGEKMPWLTVHFALPMAMLTGWFLHHVLTPTTSPSSTQADGTTPRLSIQHGLALAGLAVLTILLTVRLLSLVGGLNLQAGDSSAVLRFASAFALTAAAMLVVGGLAVRVSRRYAARHYATRAFILAAFAFLSVLTIRTAFMVTYINYDYAKEFLFYAHGAPGAKIALSQLEDLSKRVNGDMTLRIGYDSDVSWPMSWYMRDFPNARFYGEALPNDYADFDAIMVGDVNPKRAENEQKLQDNFTRFNYMLVWWPMQDYFDLTGERIAYSLVNPQARAALWDIVFNRDYTLYSQVFNKTSLTADKWSPGHRFALYFRNDIAAKVWDYRTGSVAAGTTGVVTSTLRLTGPTGIAIASSGERFVIDHKANRVVRLDINGNPISSFGGFGGTDGKFNDAWGIAVDSDGSLFVADTFNHRIQKFDANGNFLFAWGTPGVSAEPGNGRNTIFFGPRAIVMDTQGHLYVSDTGNKRIQVFDRDGNFVAQFGKSGSGDGEFNEPVGVAIDPAGNIYVADTWNQRIQVFDARYKFLRAWTVDTWKSMDPNDLQSVDHKPFLVVENNRLLVSSPKTHQVLAYTLDGKPASVPNVSFNAEALPTGLTVMNKRLYVTDANSGAVQEFDLP
jgi:uncharacterized protein (TIGR03663 family)